MRQLDDNAVTMTRQRGDMRGDLRCDIQRATATTDYTLTQRERAATTSLSSCCPLTSRWVLARSLAPLPGPWGRELTGMGTGAQNELGPRGVLFGIPQVTVHLTWEYRPCRW